ncbi:hypothetical protein PG995_014587 [Apiospora arundinis]
MFFSKSLLFASAIGVVTQVVGKTPAGFTPATETDLIVTYGQIATQDGVEVAEDAVASQPSLATATKLPGLTYAVIMVDLDIPVDTTTNPHTLLHWMQTDLKPATTATTAGVFQLQNTDNTTAIAEYVSPASPAKNSLSHRYVQLLVDTSDLSNEGLEAFRAAASQRMGFDVAATLAAAGLANNHVVAGCSFNVTSSGPAPATELKRSVPETRRMVVRAPEHWDAERKMRRQQQQQQAASKDGEGKQLPEMAAKTNSTVSVGVFERNGTIIIGVFTGNKSIPSNGTKPSNGTAPGTTVPVVGGAPATLSSSAGWTTGVVCCLLGLMFSI